MNTSTNLSHSDKSEILRLRKDHDDTVTIISDVHAVDATTVDLAIKHYTQSDVNLKQAAMLLCISSNQVNKLIIRGELESYRVGAKGRHMISWKAIHNFKFRNKYIPKEQAVTDKILKPSERYQQKYESADLEVIA